MSDQNDAGPQVAHFPQEGTTPMPDTHDNAGPEVAPFRPAEPNVDTLVPVAMLSGVITNILGVPPGTATYTPC